MTSKVDQEFKARSPLWAVPGQSIDSGFRISAEYALDHGMSEWKSYPSWPEYPDGRGLEIGLQARRDWAKRRALRLAQLAQVGVMSGPAVLRKCQVCGKEHLSAEDRWHDRASRQADLERMAVANRLTVAEVEARLGLSEIPHRESAQPEKAHGDSAQTCPGCGLPLPESRTKPKQFHNNACRMRAARKERR